MHRENDVPNTSILDRVNYAISLLEDQRSCAIHLRNDTISHNYASQPQDISPTRVGAFEVEHEGVENSNSDFADNGFGRLEIPERAAESLACESILGWTSFDDMPQIQRIKSFLLQSGTASDRSATSVSERLEGATRSSAIVYHGIREEDILALCQKFINIVLLRTPIIDVEEFNACVHKVVEHGLEWDGPTTVVVSLPQQHQSLTSYVLLDVPMD